MREREKNLESITKKLSVKDKGDNRVARVFFLAGKIEPQLIGGAPVKIEKKAIRLTFESRRKMMRRVESVLGVDEQRMKD